MKIKILTLFPEMLRPMLEVSILGRAIRAGHLEVELVNLRDYADNRHKNTDDYPFGGGAGMVMLPQPVVDAIEAHAQPGMRRVYLSPRGRVLTQRVVEELAESDSLLLLCGHYEGVDQRALDLCIDEELSIGDYVLTGGELGALVTVDAVARLIPGVLGSEESSADESFTTGLLEYPQYTRPAQFRGLRVPEVLLGGNHADIVGWRRRQALEITRARRPELLDRAPLDATDREILSRLDAADEALSSLRSRGVDAAACDLAAADAFPRSWFEAFVPAAARKAAKRQCFSGRRHVGFLYQAFSMNFAPCLEGEAAEAARREKMTGPARLYLPEKAVLIEIARAEALSDAVLGAFPRCLLANEALSRCYVRTGRADLGPYFAERS